MSLVVACARRTEPAAPSPVIVLPSSLPTTNARPAALEPSPVPAIADAGGELAVHRGRGCVIEIEALLASNVYRGTPPSQAKWDSYRQDSKYARFAESVDHGAEYLACTFSVRVNGARYRFQHNSHEGPRSLNLHAEDCAEPAEADATAQDIASFTAECTDLRRGEYYGDFLKPED